jgi:hypothetical protein
VRLVNLPNASIALVDRSKIVEYPLNREHPDNGGTAQFSKRSDLTRMIGRRWPPRFEISP